MKPDAETLQRLGELGEVQFCPAEAAVAMGYQEVNLTCLMKKNASARSAYEIGKLRSLEGLRRAQFDLARTNASMAMFLGRIYLSQGDQREGGDGEGFDVSGAGQRLRHKVAAVAAGSSPPGDRQGD